MTPGALSEICIEGDNVRSLAWDGDCLVDWVGGGQRYGIDGSIVKRRVYYAYEFDASIISSSGEYAAIFTSTGTKGLLLCNGEIVRQLNRDYYFANAYTYPIAFARLSDGRDVLVHCPDRYCQIEIEDVETGECLTKTDKRDSLDIFHSRLSVSTDGRWLMSAGWVWHPVDVVHLFDLRQALRDPHSLDLAGLAPPVPWDVSSAAFVDKQTIAVATSDEFHGDDDDKSDHRPGKNQIAIWKIGASSCSGSVALAHPPGTIMPISDRYVVSLFEHPRLIDVREGVTVHAWGDIDSGKQISSVTWDSLPPPIALDAKNARFAVAQEKTIRIIQIDLKELGG